MLKITVKADVCLTDKPDEEIHHLFSPYDWKHFRSESSAQPGCVFVALRFQSLMSVLVSTMSFTPHPGWRLTFPFPLITVAIFTLPIRRAEQAAGRQARINIGSDWRVGYNWMQEKEKGQKNPSVSFLFLWIGSAFRSKPENRPADHLMWSILLPEHLHHWEAAGKEAELGQAQCPGALRNKLNVHMEKPSCPSVSFRPFTRWYRQWWRCRRTSPPQRKGRIKSSDRWTLTTMVGVIVPSFWTQSLIGFPSNFSANDSVNKYRSIECVCTLWLQQQSSQGSSSTDTPKKGPFPSPLQVTIVPVRAFREVTLVSQRNQPDPTRPDLTSHNILMLREHDSPDH